MGFIMAQHRQHRTAPSRLPKDEPFGHDSHQPSHLAQSHCHNQRPSSAVQQHHQSRLSSQQRQQPTLQDHKNHHPQPQPQQHATQPPLQQGSTSQTPVASTYPSPHPAYRPPPSTSQHTQEQVPYYTQPSSFSIQGASNSHTAADTGDMMAATISRPPYPPMSYHTPQSNSPASVASPSGHDQQRGIYGQPVQHHQMYYSAPQGQYPSMTAQAQASPYAPQQHPQPHQPMTSQPTMMNLTHPTSATHQMTQHAGQHAQAAAMAASPRHAKIEPQSLQRTAAPGAMGASQGAQNNAALHTPTGPSAPGVNPNAAPGPIPATTPLVVRQDGNGVQWIAFEYSRDRVKMEYTIRCDVESVNTDELTPEFKTENCVYPRACCPKEQYRGNRLQYETECNTVGWALAQLNPPLRGKRGLIQRAVDSWRNSNSDFRLRSRRVRRQAKLTHRKSVPNTPHMPGMAGPSQISSSGASLEKPAVNGVGGQMHHHAHSDGHGGADDVGDDEYMSDGQHHHHHHQVPATSTSEERPSQSFSNYGGYGSSLPQGNSSAIPSIHDALNRSPSIAVRRSSNDSGSRGRDEPSNLFPDIPENKRRKFILVEDTERGARLRVRVTLDSVNPNDIPDSFRKSNSVYPRSYFPREMQSPPPSATGGKFFHDDRPDDEQAETEDDGNVDTEGRVGPAGRGSAGKSYMMVKVPLENGQECELPIPRMRKSLRGKEVRLNDLGYRMAWLQSRVFSQRIVFLQRALDCYRNKMRNAVEQLLQDVKHTAPHFETRVGKRRWTERMRRAERKDED